MANGLRKLIKKSRREFTKNSNLTRRFNRFGPRLRVEELEERIAPAAVDILPGEFATWDQGSGDGAWDADDGFLALASVSTVDKITIADISDNGVNDHTDLATDFSITVTDTDGADAEIIVIATNKAFMGDIDLSGLDAGTTTLTLVIAAGVTTTENDAGAPDQDFTINSVAYTVTSQAATAASVGDPTIANTGETFTGVTNAAILNIDLGATDFTGLTVNIVLISAGTGTIGNLDFSDSTDNDDTNLGGTIIAGSGNNIGTITVANNLTALSVTGILNAAVSVDQITGTLAITGSTSATGAITAANGISGNISATTIAGAITVTDGDLGGNITTTGNITGTITVDNAGTGDLTGNISSGGSIGTINVGDDISGDITAATSITTITSDTGDLSGAVEATAGSIGTVTLTAGSITSAGSITAGTTIGTLTVGGDVEGAVDAGGNITTIAVTGDIDDTITSGGNIGTIGAEDVTADIEADGTIGAITLTGELSAEIVAGGDFNLGASTIALGITGTGSGLRSEGGDIDGALTITNNGMASGTHINADQNMAADITATNDDLAGDILANYDISGAIDATAGSITGRISTALGDISGAITAGTAITGQIYTAVGDLLSNNVTAGAGDISNISISGAISGDSNSVTIQATGGAVTLSAAGGIDTDGNDITILGDTGVTISTSTIDSEGGDSLTIGGDDDGGDDGDVSITTSGAWTMAGDTDIDGANITITSGGSVVVDDITATVNVTSIAVTGSLTAGDIAGVDVTSISATGALTANQIAATNDVVSVTSGGTMTIVTLTATNDITSVTATGTNTAMAITTLTAGNDITDVSATGNMSITTGTAANDVVNIAADSDDSGGGSLTIGAGDLTATAGDVLNVEGAGITGDITATAGKVVMVDAGSGGYSGTITSNVATSASPLLTVIASSVIYTIETSASGSQAQFDITYIDDGAGGADPYADIEVEILSGSGYDLSLNSNTAGGLSAAEIDLNSLTIAAASISRNLGVVTVEGDVVGTLNLEGALPNNSAMQALIVQDNLLTDAVAQRVFVGSLSLLTATNIGGSTATAALADQITEIFGGGDPTSTNLTGTFTVPVGTSGTEWVFAPGAPTFSPTTSVVGFIAGSNPGEVLITFTAGVMTALDGQDSGAGVELPGGIGAGGMDLSSFHGPIVVNGDVDGTLTLANNEGVTIHGDINADVDGSAGSITAGNFLADGNGSTTVGDVNNADISFINVAGNFTVVDLTNSSIVLSYMTGGNLSVGNLTNSSITMYGITGNVSMGGVDADSAVTITDFWSPSTDISGNLSTGNVYGPMTLGGVGGNIGITWDLDAALSVDAGIGGNLTISGNLQDDAAISVAGTIGGQLKIGPSSGYVAAGATIDIANVGSVDIDGNVSGPITTGSVTSGNFNIDGSLYAAVTVNGSINNAGADFIVGGSVGDNSPITVTGAINDAFSIGGSVGSSSPIDLYSAGTLYIGSSLGSSLTVADDITTSYFYIGGTVNGAVTVYGTVATYFQVGAVNSPIYVGGNIGTYLNTSTVNANITTANIGTTVSLGAIGSSTDCTVALGTIGSTTYATQVGGNSKLELARNSAATDVGTIGGTVTIGGNMNGVLVLHGSNPALAVNIGGSVGSAILVYGDAGNITSAGDMGNASSVVAATGHLTGVISTTGDVNARIFTGGGGEDSAMTISAAASGQAVSGAIAVGLRDGITSLTIVSGDDLIAGVDTDMVALDDGDGLPAGTDGVMAVLVDAGSFDGTNPDSFDTIIFGPNAGDLTVSNVGGPDGANVGDIFIGDSYSSDINVSQEITGIITVDDDTDMSTLLNDTATFQSLASALTDSIEVASAASFATALTALGVSDMELVFGDDGPPIDFSGDIGADSVGGLVVAGDIESTIDVRNAMGHIVSLNGSIEAYVHAGISIGSIIASEDITGDFISEGTLGLDGFLGTSLDGVPDWFTGGILAEVGDICEANFAASNIDLTNIVATYGDAMGIIFVPVGNMTYTDINVAGNFGGIHVLAGSVSITLNVPSGASIDRLIAPLGSIISGHYPAADVDARSGQVIVIEGAPYEGDDLTVTVTGGNTLAIVDGDDVTLIGGLALASSLTLEGDVILLTIDGNLAGIVTVEDGNITTLVINGNWTGSVNAAGNEIETIDVDGDVSAAANLSADNFGDLTVSGSNAQIDIGSFTGTDSITWYNLADDYQTLFVKASKNVTTAWTRVFDKLTEVEVSGQGSASLLSVNADLDAGNKAELQALSRIERDVLSGKGSGYVSADGSANVGEIMVAGYNSKLKLNSILVDGELDNLELSSNKNMKSLWVSGDADSVSIANKINRAFIGGSTDLFAAGSAKNVIIEGEVGTMALANANRVTVLGTTDYLHVMGNVVNSHFMGNVASADIDGRIIRSTINGQVIVDGQLITQNFYGYS